MSRLGDKAARPAIRPLSPARATATGGDRTEKTRARPAPRFERRLRNIDVFVLFNVSAFIIICIFRYYDRFVQYRGPGNIAEFFVYATAIVAAIAGLWTAFRPYRFPTALLVAVEVGILAHFAGAFVPVDGRRLYDVYLLGVRYDKYVHFLNAAVVSALLGYILKRTVVVSFALGTLLVVLSVLGLGAVVEIVEYLVCCTIPGNGVGGYDNNMQDLISNLVGSLTWAIARALSRRAGNNEAG